MELTPTAAIVGRPNVGKSTLFNRLIGRRQAIVHDQPGVTRDRISGRAELAPGRAVTVVDTGGLLARDDHLGLNHQVLAAVEESDLLILVVDGKEGLLSADLEVWHRLRPLGKAVILAVNKADARAARDNFAEFYALGITPQVLLSAEHGRGVEDLRQALMLALPQITAPELPDAPAVAIVGRPNVGKSSLVNRLLGEARVLVSPTPGTTRDPVDSLIERGDRRYVLIDTAGIRRRSRASGTPEQLAVMMAQRQIERATVAVLVLDAPQGVTSGDLGIAGAIWERGRPAIVAANKWDLLDAAARSRFETGWPRLAELLAVPPRVNTSAVTGRGVDGLLPAVDLAAAAGETPVATAELNRLLEEFVGQHAPPSDRSGRPWKLYYATQVAPRPPTFILFANRTLPKGHTYRRYLENRLRERLGWRGVPLRLVIRRRAGEPGSGGSRGGRRTRHPS